MKYRIQESNVCVFQGGERLPDDTACGCSENCLAQNIIECRIQHHKTSHGKKKICISGAVAFGADNLKVLYSKLRDLNVQPTDVVTVLFTQKDDKFVQGLIHLHKKLQINGEDWVFSCAPTIYLTTRTRVDVKRGLFTPFLQQNSDFANTDSGTLLQRIVDNEENLYSLYFSNGGDTFYDTVKKDDKPNDSFSPMVRCLVEVMDFIICIYQEHNIGHLDIHQYNLLCKKHDNQQYIPCLIDWDWNVKHSDMLQHVASLAYTFHHQKKCGCQNPIEVYLYYIVFSLLSQPTLLEDKNDKLTLKKYAEHVVGVFEHACEKSDEKAFEQLTTDQDIIRSFHIITRIDYEQYTHKEKTRKLRSMFDHFITEPNLHTFFGDVRKDVWKQNVQTIFKRVFPHEQLRLMLFDLQSVARLMAKHLNQYNPGEITLEFSEQIQALRSTMAKMIDPLNTLKSIYDSFDRIKTLVQYDRTLCKNYKRTEKLVDLTHQKHTKSKPPEKQGNHSEVFVCLECP